MPHPTHIGAPHMFLWGQATIVSVDADTRQNIWVNVEVSADSTQTIFVEESITADNSHIVYKEPLVDGDTSHILRADIQINSDTKQIMYADILVNSDNLAVVYREPIVNADTEQLLWADIEVQADNEQIIYVPIAVNGDTQQIIYAEVKRQEHVIEIRDAAGNTVAFLSPKTDGLKDVWIDQELNSSCTLEFVMPLKSDKWAYLTDKFRLYVDNKEFVIANPDAIGQSRDGKKIPGKVLAHESWTLLGQNHDITISNDPQRTNPSWGAVIILSGGADLSEGHYAPGSAGHALYALLEGTGWSIGAVDVAGTHDLETEKESILANINQIQEKWGGYLVWDSINKTVSLRDEELWQEYSGYQIRYAKNLKGIERTTDMKVVTKLFPFGENDLDISSVNDGKLYIENYSYSTAVKTEIWHNQGIRDPQELKAEAEKYLAKVCKPRHHYSIEHLDLRVLPGFQHEEYDIGYLVDVIDEDLGVNDKVRVTRHRYNVFQPWQCDLELGDPLESVGSMLADADTAAKYLKSNVKPNTSFQNLLKAVINTAATEINGADGCYTEIDGISTWLDPDTGDLLRITPKGLIISSDGGQNWQTAISGKGIHADSAWVGKITAGMIQIGAGTTFEDGYNPTEKETPAGAQEKASEAQQAAEQYALEKAQEAKDAAVLKGEPYNGVVINTANGLTVTRSDGKVLSSLNATDGLKIQKKSGAGWEKVLYGDTEGNLVLKGRLEAGTVISNSTIEGGAFIGGTITLGETSTEQVFKADTNGIYLGNNDFASAPFRVDMDGKITATKANIKGNIDCDSLKINGTNILDTTNKIVQSALDSSTSIKINNGNTARSYFDASGNLKMSHLSNISWDELISPVDIGAKDRSWTPSSSDLPSTVVQKIGRDYTYLDKDGIYSPYIEGGRIVGGSIESDTNIDVGTNVYIGNKLVISTENALAGISWGSTAYNAPQIYLDTGGLLQISNNGKPIYAGSQRIDIPSVAVFG